MSRSLPESWACWGVRGALGLTGVGSGNWDGAEVSRGGAIRLDGKGRQSQFRLEASRLRAGYRFRWVAFSLADWFIERDGLLPTGSGIFGRINLWNERFDGIGFVSLDGFGSVVIGELLAAIRQLRKFSRGCHSNSGRKLLMPCLCERKL